MEPKWCPKGSKERVASQDGKYRFFNGFWGPFWGTLLEPKPAQNESQNRFRNGLPKNEQNGSQMHENLAQSGAKTQGAKRCQNGLPRCLREATGRPRYASGRPRDPKWNQNGRRMRPNGTKWKLKSPWKPKQMSQSFTKLITKSSKNE